jgi:L-asparaginase
MKIRLLITGGTIDKVYNQSNGELEFDQTHFPDIITRARVEVDLLIEELLLIDSLDMVDSDRELIVEKCTKCEEKYILITHGTDTMCETAKLLGESSIDKTIVLFGSMIPYAVNGSDAFFNFGCALGSLQLLEAGVYIVMNGRTLSWTDVEKNRNLGIFQKRSS